jgi:benzoylformate decarboxylase
VHIGSDPWELGKNQPGTLVLGDERATVAELRAALAARPSTGWMDRGAATATRLAARRAELLAADRTRAEQEPGSAQRAFLELAAALPADVVVVDESMSSYELAARHLPRQPGSWFRGAGGIGMGLPRAIGVRLAHPDRPVVSVVGDGASLYSLTALWTAAHHKLPIVWVILDNKAYRTLKQNTLKGRRPDAAQHEFVGADLTDPDIDFVAIAEGFGARAWRVTDPAKLGAAVTEALACGGPAVVDLALDGRP